MLSGLLVCAECGEHMHLDRRKAKGHIYETYYCNHYHIGLRRDVIEPFIREKCIDLLSADQYENDREALIEALQASLPTEADNSALKAEVAQIDRKMGRIADAIMETDVPPDILVTKLKELETEKKKLQAQISEAEKGIDFDKIRKTSDRIRSSVLSVLKNENSTADALRDAVSVFVSEIVISKVAGVASITIKHGIPGYVITSEVADDPRQKVLRPSAYFAKTLNRVRTISTIYSL